MCMHECVCVCGLKCGLRAHMVPEVGTLLSLSFLTATEGRSVTWLSLVPKEDYSLGCVRSS